MSNELPYPLDQDSLYPSSASPLPSVPNLPYPTSDQQGASVLPAGGMGQSSLPYFSVSSNHPSSSVYPGYPTCPMPNPQDALNSHQTSDIASSSVNYTKDFHNSHGISSKLLNTGVLSKVKVPKIIQKGLAIASSSIQQHYGSPSYDVSYETFACQDFASLKHNCRRNNILFEDSSFHASNKILQLDETNPSFVLSYFNRTRYETDSIKWLRPHEICKRDGANLSPCMFVGRSDRFDINQGEIGNCWFLAALANLVENDKLFRCVVPHDQDFNGDYCGIFRFRFWRFGKWVEVVIDDFLPTRNGRLIYLRSTDRNEFWGALLEKAYAKFYGSYKNLEGGLTIEAAVDFTGGIPEAFRISEIKSPLSLLRMMLRAHRQGAFMGCSLHSNSSRYLEAKQKGLRSGHAYTITKVVEIQSATIAQTIPLVRVRDPHGNDREWNGAWSDDDRHWRAIPQSMRSKLGLTFKADGEFYMSLRDFIKYFDEIEICHLTPQSIDTTAHQDYEGSTRWSKNFDVFTFDGEWSIYTGTAGGCGNNRPSTFWQNPQFFIDLHDPDPYDEETHCPVIVSLMQRQVSRKSEFAIGFKIFACQDPMIKHLDKTFFKYNNSIERTETFVNLREVSKRLRLPPGRYAIIPCTFDAGLESKFLLRVFVETSWGSTDGVNAQRFKSAFSLGDYMNNLHMSDGKSAQQSYLSDKSNKPKYVDKTIRNVEEFFRDGDFDLLNKIIKSIL